MTGTRAGRSPDREAPSGVRHRVAECRRAVGPDGGEQVSRLGHALERVLAAIDESQPRASGELAGGRADENLAGCRLAGDPSGYVQSDSACASLDALELAGVDSGPDCEAELVNACDHRERAADRARRAVERGEE